MKKLILLPGFGCDHTMYTQIKQLLAAEDVALSTYDFGTYGVDYAINSVGDIFTNKLLSEHQGTEKFIIVSYSLGLFSAISFATKHPDKVEKIIMFSPPLITRPGLKAKVTKYANKFMWKTLLSNRLQKFLYKLLFKMPGSIKLFEVSGLLYTKNEDLFRTFVVETPAKSMFQCFYDLTNTDMTEQLTKLSVPVSIYRGNKDRVVKMVEGDVNDKLIRNIKTTYLDSNHDIPEDYPELTVEIIKRELANASID